MRWDRARNHVITGSWVASHQPDSGLRKLLAVETGLISAIGLPKRVI